MFRAFFIYISKSRWIKNLVTNWSVAWMFASRFIAGETLDDALKTIEALNQKGINATLDHLGEHTRTSEEAIQATQDILSAIDAITETKVRANVSIKLTQIGLNVDPQLCAENLTQILKYASESRNFIRIDMEDSPVTQQTLDLVWKMRNDGLLNVGAVIQAYLYRSEEDIRELMTAGIPVRLCKGAYKEPPTIAFPHKDDVDRNFDKLTSVLIDGAQDNASPDLSDDGRIPPIPAIASHDDARIEFAMRYACDRGLDKLAIEFQMLNGIRRDLQEDLIREGYPVRVYVPYGTEWYPYMMRRLAERPANLWFFLSNFFRR